MTIERSFGIKAQLGLLAVMALGIAGCGPSQRELTARDRLEVARRAYDQARADPNIQAYAPAPVNEARSALAAAEYAKDPDEKEHLAYVAQRKIQTASVTADAKLAEERISALEKETAQLLAERREREAERDLRIARQEAEARAREAQMRAAQAQAQAETQAQQAQRQREQAERERQKAEMQARQAEQQRLQAEAQAREAEARAREAEKARAETVAFLREISELAPRQTDRGVVLTLGGIHFATGHATLSESARRSVDKLADFMRKHPDQKVVVGGFTDNVGSEDFNLELSQRRADSVRDRLVADGVNPNRIITEGYGEHYFVAGNDTEEGRRQNRRVEILLPGQGTETSAVVRHD
jgi:outer membrane protein OmpA-like peptidoglycan-associated protein